MNKTFMDLPHGIEVLILKASIDPDFKMKLLELRAEAAKEIGLELSAAEAAMLAAIPREQLENIIDQAEVPAESRRAFLGTAAAAMIAALGLDLTGCSSLFHGIRSGEHRNIYPLQCEGIRPDFQVGRTLGIQPDYGLGNIYFDYDKSDIRADQYKILERNIKYFQEHSEAKIMIVGHTDERGTTEYNLALGERRAQAVRDYLVRNGVATKRLKIISKGKEEPFDPGHSEDAWAKNRRVHFLRLY